MPSLSDIFGDFEPTPVATTPAPAPIPSCAPEAPPLPAPTPRVFGHDLSDETILAARAAAEAVDAEGAAKTALDARREVIKAKLEQELVELEAAHKNAKTRREEAEALLLKIMGVEKLNRIPMDDRPDIQIKITPGRKQNITKKWLDNPEGVVVKTYGPDAPDVIWNAAPKSDPTTDVIVPARYDDEPGR
jgi:hypothetical protein